jgi:hypothetical protein
LSGGIGSGTGGETVNFEFAGGGFTDRLSYTYAFEYRDEQPIPIQSRSEHDSWEDSSRAVPLLSRGLLIRDQYYYPLHLHPGATNVPYGQLQDLTTGELLASTCEDADPGYTLAPPEMHAAYASSFYGTYCGFDSSSNGTLTNARERASVYLSGTYELNDKVQLVAGFHEGMTAMFGTDPETADNMELGLRYSDGSTGVEIFYFESDYQSLKAACTNSQGGSCDDGDVFDGGAVDVSGIELSGSMILASKNGISYPLGITYTSTDAIFENSFDDDGEYWGVVAEGDDVPYVPDSSLALVAGFLGSNGLTGNIRYVRNGSSCSTASCGTYQTIDSHSYLDMSLRKSINESIDLYLIMENLLDSENIVARAPKDGIRSQKPRTIKVGFSLDF